jgi:hypothetical protein
MKTSTAYTILRLIESLKCKAMHVGRYQPPYTVAAYDNRDKSKAFQCISYKQCVRRVNALVDMFYAAVPLNKDKETK